MSPKDVEQLVAEVVYFLLSTFFAGSIHPTAGASFGATGNATWEIPGEKWQKDIWGFLYHLFMVIYWEYDGNLPSGNLLQLAIEAKWPVEIVVDPPN